LVMVKPS